MTIPYIGLLSNFTMNKTVTMGFWEFGNVIAYSASVLIPMNNSIIQIEGPTQVGEA